VVPTAHPRGRRARRRSRARGFRGYLAIAGGFAVERVLGSASTDLNAALGPFEGRTLRRGDVLATGSHKPASVPRHVTHLPAHWSLDPRPWFDTDPVRPIRFIRGSHFDALDATSQRALFESTFRISGDSNRVGLRLDGAALALRAPLELVSEAVAFGTVQLPPGGQPIVLMAEHPTTGGYPRIAQVAAIDLPRLAQRRLGATLRFAEIGLDDAQTRYLRREHELARLAEAIAQRLKP
jgi:antagonist of KipI